MSFFYKENSPLCFFCIADCPDFILLYVPEVLSQKHFEKCSDCLGSRCFDLAIVHSLVQLAELEWSSPTDDDELPEVTGPAWIVDNVAHYGG